MRLAILAQERPARNALTAVVHCANPMRKPVADVARPAAHPEDAAAPQRITVKFGSEKELKERSTKEAFLRPTETSSGAPFPLTAKGCKSLCSLRTPDISIPAAIQTTSP
jgi:hypothetical protein